MKVVLDVKQYQEFSCSVGIKLTFIVFCIFKNYQKVAYSWLYNKVGKRRKETILRSLEID